ncbi:MAG: response regulator [Planctomycetes bacterium]|nr:response regulator [Planctomycetota bacterium]
MSEMWKLLVIDDDSMIRDLFARALPSFGFQAILAPDGKSGLQLLEEHPDVAVVVLDWMMPGLDGMEVLERIQARGNPPPVMMMSAKSRKEDVVSAIKQGVKDYVTKPVHLGQLVLRLNSLIERHREQIEKASSNAETYLGFEASSQFTIVDISHTGVCLDSSFPVDKGAILFIESPEIATRIGLPPEYNFAVRVANCKEAGKRYRLGSTFVGMNEDTTESIRNACHSAAGFKAGR